MTLQEIIELVQQHHPEMGHNEITLEANRALDDFSVQTKMVKGTFTFNTVIDQRFYDLDNNILEIEEVVYDSSSSGGRSIPRLVYKPNEKDIG
tara:strand:+ start:335 stop:613 length:279 start_codon:yes stop_codon:yes gene_type:complete